MISLIIILCLVIVIYYFFFYESENRLLSDLEIFNNLIQKEEPQEEENNPKEKVFFKDIAGLKEIKEELEKIVNYFNRKEKNKEKNFIKIPKGILLYGPPGNGKTLLGKALANECNIPFIYRSASSIESPFYSGGAQKLRRIFNEAKKLEKKRGGCIIFIEEIDSIAKNRNLYISQQGHEQTLNQLLTLLDGLIPMGDILFICTTNRQEILDKALLRPGRIDLSMFIPLPGLSARRELTKMLIEKKKLDESWTFFTEEISSFTENLNSSQINQIFEEVNNELIVENRKFSKEIFFRSLEKVLLGPVSIDVKISKDKQLLIAYHELGHAIVALVAEGIKLRRISIIPRQRNGGYTWVGFREEDDLELLTKEQLLNKVTVLLSGLVSEKFFFGRDGATTGCSSDLEQANKIIDEYILRYGMSDLGVVDLNYKNRKEFFEEKKRIINSCLKRSKEIIVRNEKVIKILLESLLEKKSLNEEEINYIYLNKNKPSIKFLEKGGG